jgi:hypothetical protein
MIAQVAENLYVHVDKFGPALPGCALAAARVWSPSTLRRDRPVSLMLAVANATSGLALVTEIDLGYFDKLLVAPIRRSSIIFGRPRVRSARRRRSSSRA